MLRKTIFPVIVGNILEWYDFALYGFMTPVIARHFFSTESPFLSILATFFIFATGFLARPLGAIFFGHAGDRYGRTVSLSLSVSLMAIATTLIGLLPTYESLGSAATLLLLVARLVQGFAIGGEFTVSVAYIIEHAPTSRRTFYGSLTMVGTFGGLLLGSVVIMLLNNLFDVSFVERWGWRIPFLLGLPLGLIGLWLRFRLPETPEFLLMSQRDERLPLVQLFRTHWSPLLKATGMVLFGAISFTLWFVWLPFYAGQSAVFPARSIFLVNSINLMVILVAIPLIGAVADKMVAKRWLITGAVTSFILAWPTLRLVDMSHAGTFWLLQFIFALSTSCAYAVIPRLLYDCFPVTLRCSGISLGYNAANLLASFVPMVATVLVHNNHLSDIFPLVMLPALISFLAVYRR